MLDFSFEHILFTVVVAIVVIGPKDLPRALRTAGRWIGKMRRISGHFRTGLETMIREAELEEMEKQWREQNAAIIAQHPEGHPHPEAQPQPEALPHPASAEAALAPPPPAPPPPPADKA